MYFTCMIKRKRYSGSMRKDIFADVIIIAGPFGSISNTIEKLCEEAIAVRKLEQGYQLHLRDTQELLPRQLK